MASLGTLVAIVWTRPLDDLVSMAWHDTGGPDDLWQASPDAPVTGLRLGEDQLSVATDRSPGAERLFVAVRTSAEEAPNRGRLDPQVVVVEFSTDADPMSYLFGRVEEQHGGPIILVNSDARELYVAASAPKAGGPIYYKTASLDRIAFPTGLGTLLIPATEQHPRLESPTSTKQALDETSGLVIAATDTLAGLYGFGALGVDATAGTPAPSDGSPAAVPIVDNTFDGLAVGAAVPGWVVDGDPLPSFVIRVLTGSNSSARLSSSTTDARACVAFREISEGVLRVEAETLFNLATEGELRMLQVRGVSGELVAIRLRNREVVYQDGPTRVRSGLILAPGRWYHSVLTLDLATKTYAIELRDATDDSILLQDEGLVWRSTDSSIVNRVCAELPPQPGLDLYLDDVRVTSNAAAEG